MTLSHIIGSIKRYGLRGIVEYILRYHKTKSFANELSKTLIRTPDYQPEHGITIIGSISFGGSLSKVLRDFIKMLKMAEIPHQVFDTGCDNPIPESEYQHLLTPQDGFRLNRFDHIIGMFSLPKLPKLDAHLSRFGFWEFEEGFCEAYPEFLEPPDVLATSDFNQVVMTKSVPTGVKVHKILYPFQFDAQNIPAKNIIRAKYGLSPSDFVIFFNFDFRSGFFRKNPEGLIRAFARAFRDLPDTKLVFKTMRANQFPHFVDRINQLCKNEGIWDRFVSIDSYIPQEDIVGLTNACDVYASLHRGEGFGLGIAEAMSLGKAVVVTNYSAPTEFCNEDNALLVPYQMVPVRTDQRDINEYKYVTHWAEPDIDAAATSLRELYNKPDLRAGIGANAKKFIAEYFSFENFKKSVRDFLSSQNR